MKISILAMYKHFFANAYVQNLSNIRKKCFVLNDEFYV